MRVQIYTCPSCGGKVEFDKEEKIWNCLYCKKKYKALFSYDYEYDTPDLIVQEQNYNIFHCSKCNNSYVDSKNESECTCGAKNKKHKTFSLTSFSNAILNDNSINDQFNNELRKSCPDNLLKIYKKIPFEYKYVECVTLSGFVELSYHNHRKRYVFINVLLPNMDFEDYRFFYELANDGFNYNTLVKGAHSNIIEEINKKGKLIKQIDEQEIISFDHKQIEEEIFNNCLEYFQNDLKIQNSQDITVKKEFQFMRGNYIPVAYKTIELDGEYYRQYFISGDAIDLRNDNPFLFEYPTNPRHTSTLKKFAFFNNLAEKILVYTLLLLFPFIFIGMVLNISKILFFVVLLLMLSGITYLFTLKKKIQFQYITRLSREEYIDRIIHHSSYVKEIEV